MDLFPGVFQLNGAVQKYSWGGYEFIARLTGLPNEKGEPFAEYWLGAHPNHPATLTASGTSLAKFVEDAPEEVLGADVHHRFGSLPYLLKILDVRQMLSIQVHPDKASAEKGYDEEDRRGIDLKRPDRNYKDRNHKPESMVAIGDFWLLHGFKDEAPLEQTLQSIPEFSPLQKTWKEGGYEGLYKYVMYLPQEEVDKMLAPLVERIMPLYVSHSLKKDQADFWAARAVQTFCKNGHYDRGIFSVYFFNLVHLRPGEGVYQAAGLPHAYLEGQNVEIMSNSDNVLRAGLTDKHIDVAELMKHVRFEATHPNILRPAGETHTIFESPAAEYELQRYHLSAGKPVRVNTVSAEIFLVLGGKAVLKKEATQLALNTGDAALALAGSAIELSTETSADIFRVTVPAAKD